MSHSTEAAAASSGASTPSTSSVVSNIHSSGRCSCTTPDDSDLGQFRRRQSLLLAKQMEAKCATNVDSTNVDVLCDQLDCALSSNATILKRPPHAASTESSSSITIALNDTPATTAPSSPYAKGAQEPMAEMAKLLLPQGALASSGTSTPRSRPTTLDIPGLTKSKVSPDGRIASRDVGSKLVIVMVGLPARGKSYITKKLARYLNWLQHDTRIFNVGERRRQVSGGPNDSTNGVNGSGCQIETPDLGEPHKDGKDEQNAAWFDPDNKKASAVREQLARETLDELLNYILNQNGSVGILDATNSTMERRKMVMDCIRERAGPDLNVLFLESRCVDQDLLEANMRLKLNGPDYKGMDPHVALADFKQRVKAYEKAYVPLGDYEEKHNMPYIQMIDVGRKVISHQIKGFLMAQANYYLLNFNLAPRQIWITRHGLSLDNMSGKIGGDSDLAPEGVDYARCLTRFINAKREEWDLKQLEASKNTHFPPLPGDSTPPNPYYHPQHNRDGSISDETTAVELAAYSPKPFCVWTSMLKRSIQTAQFFDEEAFDTKQMRMLDELNAGVMEGLTYSCISTQFPEEYRARKADKLHYRYPGPGGEGYLDIINRMRPVIVELERMTDHVLLVGHRSVARVLLAYFRGLRREEVADLDVPIGLLYCLEPKPYGVDFKVYKWDKAADWFSEVPDFKLKPAEDDMQ